MTTRNSLFLDFEEAIDKKDNGKQNQIPKHQNVIKNYVNVEFFHKEDKNKEQAGISSLATVSLLYVL